MRLFLLLLALAGSAPEPAKEPGAIGDPAQLFYLRPLNPELAGMQLVDLNLWVGPKATEPRRVLLSFAAEFCVPCKKELAAYAVHHQALRDAGAQIVVVLVDENDEARKKMQAYLRDEVKLPFPVVADKLRLIARGYGVSSLPHNVIIGRDGRIAWVKKGYAEGLSIPALLEALATPK